MIKFECVTGNVTLNDDVKNWSFEKLKETFDKHPDQGGLDYVALAKQLGITPAKAAVQKPKDEAVGQDSTSSKKDK